MDRHDYDAGYSDAKDLYKDTLNSQQAKIDKLEEAIKYLMDNVDIPIYELELCGLIETKDE